MTFEFAPDDHGLEPARPAPRKGFYYRSYKTGRRLYFSENEIASIVPKAAGYALRTTTGGVFHVQSSLPGEVEFEAPYRESVPGNHYYRRS